MGDGVQPAAMPSLTRRACLYALAVIFFANFLSYLDRQIVSALEKELKAPPFTIPASWSGPSAAQWRIERVTTDDAWQRTWRDFSTAETPEVDFKQWQVLALFTSGLDSRWVVDRVGHTTRQLEIVLVPGEGPGGALLVKMPRTSWGVTLRTREGAPIATLDPAIPDWKKEAPPGGFGLTKKQFGYTWTAFTVGYMVFAPLIGFLIVRTRRTWVFAVCIFLWSLATIWSGLAHSLFELYTARFCIGIGEAGCLVIGPTLLADYFPLAQRGRALSIFFLGLPLGGTAGYIVTGLVVSGVGDWRPAFYVAGIPGILLSVLVLMLTDPPREAAEPPAPGAAPALAPPHIKQPAPVRGIAPYLALLKNRTLLLIILAQAFAVIILVPLLHFGVEFFEAERGMEKKAATTTLGLIALVAGGFGNLLSGIIGDRLSKRGIKGAYALLAGLAFSAGLPFMLIGFTSANRAVFLPALTMGAFCYFLCMPAVNTQIANSVTAVQRPMAYALAVFILHLLGDTFAPPIFGGVSDAIGKQRTFTYFAFTLVLAGACCLLAWRTAARDEAAAGGGATAPGATPHH